MTNLNKDHVNAAAQAIRLLSIEAIQKANSGHLGLPLGCAEVAATLWGYFLKADDQFVLSAGHGSMLLYSLLHLRGDISIEDVKNFRQDGSKTPGHPEFGHTAGVSCTTGPLGQGIANAVGMALARKHTQANGTVWALCGDGCLQEGISYEACALAGHWQLDNLVLIYDQNGITLDNTADKTQSETLARFEAAGWDVIEEDGHNVEALYATMNKLTNSTVKRPKVLVVKTTVGKGIAEVEGLSAAHGEAGVKYAEEAIKRLGWEGRQAFEVPAAAYELFADAPKQTQHNTAANNAAKLANELKEIPALTDKAIATRAAGGLALNEAAKRCPELLSGSADLFGSNKNYLKELGDFSAQNYQGRNIHFGIREHAMASICNGIAYDGRLRAACATFMVFSDYMRPAIRLAALSKIPTMFVLTHDSVFVGEDGPTHQPVEHLASLRLIPGLNVYRPADAEETLGAVAAAMQNTTEPSALILSRQSLPLLDHLSLETRRQGALQGGYVAFYEQSNLEQIVIASGSEVAPAIEYAKANPGTRVVSMVCLEAFKKLPQAKQDEILPPTCQNRTVVEAATPISWNNIASKFVGVEGFGQSAPATAIAQNYQLNAEGIAKQLNAQTQQPATV